eukprot:Platyproteum_vivax@DN3823_c0_g1_i1.p1
MQSGKQKCIMTFVIIVSLASVALTTVSLVMPSWIKGHPSVATTLEAGSFQICDDAIFPRILKHEWKKIASQISDKEVSSLKGALDNECVRYADLPAPTLKEVYGVSPNLIYVGRYISIGGAAVGLILTIISIGFIFAGSFGAELYALVGVGAVACIGLSGGVITCALFFDQMRNHVVNYPLWLGTLDINYSYCMYLAAIGAGLSLVAAILTNLVIVHKSVEKKSKDEEEGLLARAPPASERQASNYFQNMVPAGWQFWAPPPNHPAYYPPPPPGYMQPPPNQMAYRGPPLPGPAPPIPAAPYQPPPYQPQGAQRGMGGPAPMPRPPPAN